MSLANGRTAESGLKWTQWTATERVVSADATLSTQSTKSTKSTFAVNAHSPVRPFAAAGLRS